MSLIASYQHPNHIRLLSSFKRRRAQGSERLSTQLQVTQPTAGQVTPRRGVKLWSLQDAESPLPGRPGRLPVCLRPNPGAQVAPPGPLPPGLETGLRL